MIVELFHCITRIKPLNKVVYKVVFKMAAHEIKFLAHLERLAYSLQTQTR